MIAALLLGITAMVGKTYAEVPLPVAREAVSEQARRAFTDTLNGPQTPAVVVRLGGREYVVFETCTAHLCAFNHSVIVTNGDDLYVATYEDDKKIVVVPNARIEALVGDVCLGGRCTFPNVVATGMMVTPEPLRGDDLKATRGGAHCRVEDRTGRLVLYTEGRALMRWGGRLRHLAENGIGTDALYSVDGRPPIVVNFRDRPGISTRNYEMSVRPRTITILVESQSYSFPVFVKCES